MCYSFCNTNYHSWYATWKSDSQHVLGWGVTIIIWWLNLFTSPNCFQIIITAHGTPSKRMKLAAADWRKADDATKAKFQAEADSIVRPARVSDLNAAGKRKFIRQKVMHVKSLVRLCYLIYIS